MRGTTYKKGDRWFARFDEPRGADGKRKRVYVDGSFPTQAAAQEGLSKDLANIATGTYVPRSDLTVAAYLEGQWLPYISGRVRPRTAERYAELIRDHIAPGLGHVKLSALRPLHVQAWLDGLKRKDGKGELSGMSRLHAWRVGRAALKQACRWQLLGTNPFDAVEPPRAVRADSVKVSTKEAGKMLAAARGTALEIPVALGIGAGLRRGEMHALRWSDVDSEAGTLSISRSLDAKGRFGEPKSVKSHRVVSVPPFVVDTLRRHKSAQAERRLALGAAWLDHDLVLAGPMGAPQDVGETSHRFHRFTVELGMPGVRLHDLRHAFAAVSLAAGTPLPTISAQMGHANIGITFDLYAHVERSLQTEAAARLEAVLGEA